MTIAERFEQQIQSARGDRAVLKSIFDQMINVAVGGSEVLSLPAKQALV
jgi:hypothetical protein